MNSDFVRIRKKEETDRVVALVGNPNVGKSTLFNALTGMNQHTGNWPGKTVAVAQGRSEYKGKGYIFIDLPGTYSLLSRSEEERIAVEFLSSGQADCVVVVADATAMERSLAFLFQVMQFKIRTVLCVNLLDQAEKAQIHLDLSRLAGRLGLPVVGCTAARKEGTESLRECLRMVNDGFCVSRSSSDISNLQDICPACDAVFPGDAADVLYARAERLAGDVITADKNRRTQWFERIAVGRVSGRVVMVAILFLIFWITISGANYPSMMLETMFSRLYEILFCWMKLWPAWVSGILLDGIYSTTSKVVSVMLPPILIFFPLFTLLEDLGYLPRAAYMMDHCFQRCGTCGKQVLTMSLGFGCNAAGVMGCRIISSRKDRLIAIITNALVPCNGKFPAMIALISLLFSENSVYGALVLTALVLLGISATCLCTKLLSSLFSEQNSDFILELPAYRRPQWKKILVRSFMDRIIFVLGRAAAVSAPAGAFIWCMHTVTLNGSSILTLLSQMLDPLGSFLGMNGAIFLSFILAFPANELFLPCVIMLLSGGAFLNGGASLSISSLLNGSGCSDRIVVCMLVFILFHWPCSTTCLTIRKETGSWKWMMAAIGLPTILGMFLCMVITRL